MSQSAIPSRRQVLRGAGGFTLALPFLPSLRPRAAAAQTASRPCLFWLGTGHGGAYETNMFPPQSLLTRSADIFPDHQMRWGALAATTQGTDAAVSPILKARATTFTPRLMSKMNVLYGLDVPFYIAHNTGLHLGNYARNDGNDPNSGGVVQKDPRPTIDQILAWSPNFYPNLAGVRERVMVMGMGGQISWNYANPMARSGGIQAAPMTQSSQDLFSRVFTPGETPMMTAKRPAIVDRVLANYKTLRESNRRLSAQDKLRLDAHMASLAELQRKLATSSSPMCGKMTKPVDDAGRHEGSGPAEYMKFSQLFNDIVVAAFACGVSRLAALSSGFNEQGRAVGYTGSWHQDVAHNWPDPARQAQLVQAYQIVFEGIFVDLASKLDAVIDTNGQSALDNTLMAWSQESCMSTHDSMTIPVVTFGSAGGYFKTGQLFDFRRVTNPKSSWTPGAVDPATGKKFVMYNGLLYSQWLGTVLQSMGSPPSEWERWGHKGYGVPFMSPPNGNIYAGHYVNNQSRYFTMASDPLPGVKAG